MQKNNIIYSIEDALDILKNDGVLAYPTETFFGIGLYSTRARGLLQGEWSNHILCYQSKTYMQHHLSHVQKRNLLDCVTFNIIELDW